MALLRNAMHGSGKYPTNPYQIKNPLHQWRRGFNYFAFKAI